MKVFELYEPIIRNVKIGRQKATKNLTKSALRAIIIMIDGPIFSVLLNILRILTQCIMTMKDMTS